LDAWPVGSVFLSVVSTSPATLLGGGTWAAFGAGKMLVGRDGNDTDFDTAEETGGSKTVTLTAAQSGLPQHTHVQDAHTHNFLPRSATTGGVSSIVTGTLDTSSTISGSNQPHVQSATAVNQNAGPSNAAEAHSNMPPYIVVYMWKRTA
jgi:microcystin-dependent protein